MDIKRKGTGYYDGFDGIAIEELVLKDGAMLDEVFYLKDLTQRKLFLNGPVTQDTVLDTVRFADVISDADMIFTGEGKIDSQSLRGKVVIGVAKRARLQNVPVTVIVGGADNDIDPAYGMGVTAVFSINRLPQDFSVSRHKSVENMTLTADNVLRLIKAAEQLKG